MQGGTITERYHRELRQATRRETHTHLLCEQLNFCRDVTEALDYLPLLCLFLLELVTLTSLSSSLRLVASVLQCNRSMIALSLFSIESSCSWRVGNASRGAAHLLC